MNKRVWQLTLALVIAYVGPTAADDARFLGFTAPVPSTWDAQPPETSMRLLQFRVPGDKAEDANMIMYYFGPGKGGSVTDNIARWRSQFIDVGGDAMEPRVSEFDVGGTPITLVELTGTYARGVGLGPTGEGVPDQTLLAAIIETADGTVFAQLFGPTETVNAARSGFENFLTGITPIEAPASEPSQPQGQGG
jgi:hypothetical protein